MASLGVGFFFLAKLHSKQDVSFLTRDWTCTPAVEAQSEPLDQEVLASLVLLTSEHTPLFLCTSYSTSQYYGQIS